MTQIFGITGWSGCGKTSLITHILPILGGYGLRVSTIKHAHHHFDIDKSGKDSYRHRDAGVVEVMISSAHRWALMHESREGEETPLTDLIQHMTAVDLVLVEGYKSEPHAKLEIHRPSLGKSLLQPSDGNIVGVASDADLGNLPVPVLDLNNPAAVADFIIEHCALSAAAQ
jgi:molybdopterin-guanine dinucleotide biosynthesis protein B